jgi:hypothetical protein
LNAVASATARWKASQPVPRHGGYQRQRDEGVERRAVVDHQGGEEAGSAKGGEEEAEAQHGPRQAGAEEEPAEHHRDNHHRDGVGRQQGGGEKGLQPSLGDQLEQQPDKGRRGEDQAVDGTAVRRRIGIEARRDGVHRRLVDLQVAPIEAGPFGQGQEEMDTEDEQPEPHGPGRQAPNGPSGAA